MAREWVVVSRGAKCALRRVHVAMPSPPCCRASSFPYLDLPGLLFVFGFGLCVFAEPCKGRVQDPCARFWEGALPAIARAAQDDILRNSSVNATGYGLTDPGGGLALAIEGRRRLQTTIGSGSGSGSNGDSSDSQVRIGSIGDLG